MHIAVTGANGFIGQALCQYLSQKGEAAIGISRTPAALVASENRVLAEYSDSNAATKALRGCEAVIHLAGRAHQTQDTAADPLSEYRQINVQHSVNLATAAQKAGIKRFVYISSIKVNGERTTNTPYCTDTPPAPKDDYGLSKWEAEQALTVRCKEIGLDLVIVRPPLVYGSEAKGNLATLKRALQMHLPLPLASIRNRRDMISVTNLCSLLYCCCIHPKAPGNTFLAADGHPLSTSELIKLIAESVQTHALMLPFPPAALRSLCKILGQESIAERLLDNLEVDISYTCKTLEWSPPQTPKQGFSDPLNENVVV